MKHLLAIAVVLLSLGTMSEVSNAIAPCAELNEKYNEPIIETELWDRCVKAASDGDSGAQLEFALFLIRAHENNNNIQKGLYWLKESAKNGKRLAQIAIGGLLSRPESGIELDLVQAYAWFVLAHDNQAMTRVETMMDKEQLFHAKKLAESYVEKYRSEW